MKYVILITGASSGFGYLTSLALGTPPYLGPYFAAKAAFDSLS